MDKKNIGNIIPYLIFLCTIFNLVLNQVGISYLYVFITVVGIVYLLLKGIKIYSCDILFFLIILLVVISSFGHAIVNQEFLMTMQGLGVYLLFPIYWFLLFRQKKVYDFKLLLKKTIPWVYIIALLGIIQFVLSPDLYGLLNDSNSNSIEWASGADLSSYSAFFRSSSILGSPQVYGLFLALYFIVMTEFYSLKENEREDFHLPYPLVKSQRPETAQKSLLFTKHGRTKHRALKYIKAAFRNNIIGFLSLVYIVAAILSGNKSVILVLLIYLLYKFIKENTFNKLKMTMKLLIILVPFIYLFPMVSDQISIRALDRLVNIESIASEEEGGRLQTYKDLLLQNDIILGSGTGAMMNLAGKDGDATVAESYLLQMLLELGIFNFITFIAAMLIILIFASRKNIKTIKVLLLAIFASMMVVHAFNSPVFFIFWGVIMYAYSTIVKSDAKPVTVVA